MLRIILSLLQIPILYSAGLHGSVALGAGSTELAFHEQARMLPNIHFQSETGERVSLASFRGQYVLLNVWATWCGPCREEMPSLDRLASLLDDTQYEVIALSQDKGGNAIIRQYYQQVGIQQLKIYWDTTNSTQRLLRSTVLPTTMLIDPDGYEVGRWIGAIEWDAPAIVKKLASLSSAKQ